MSGVYLESDINKHIEALKKYLTAKKCTKMTIDYVLTIARDFLRYIYSKGKDLETFNDDDVLDYFHYKSKKCRGSTLRMYYNYLRTIFRGLGIEHKWTEKLQTFKIEDSEVYRPFYTVEETIKILKTALKYDLQTAVMVFISAYTGVRRWQICQLNIGHYDRPNLIIPSAKHGRTVIQELPGFVCDMIEELIKLRVKQYGNNPNIPLFMENGKRMHPVRMNAILRDVCIRAGVYKPRAGFHAFRRGKVTRVYKAGMREVEITLGMGWSPGSQMVHIYTQLDRDEIKNKLKEKDTLYGAF